MGPTPPVPQVVPEDFRGLEGHKFLPVRVFTTEEFDRLEKKFKGEWSRSVFLCSDPACFPDSEVKNPGALTTNMARKALGKRLESVSAGQAGHADEGYDESSAGALDDSLEGWEDHNLPLGPSENPAA